MQTMKNVLIVKVKDTMKFNINTMDCSVGGILDNHLKTFQEDLSQILNSLGIPKEYFNHDNHYTASKDLKLKEFNNKIKEFRYGRF